MVLFITHMLEGIAKLLSLEMYFGIGVAQYLDVTTLGES